MPKKQNDIHEEETRIIELVNSFENKEKLEKIKEKSKWVGMGSFMGMSDAIPGYSGGTTLALIGFFKKLILISKSVFIPEPGITRMKALMFIIPFCVGWIAGVFGFAKLTEYMAEHHMGLELIFFFSTFVTLCIPIFIKAEKPKLINSKNKKIIKKNLIMFIIGFIIVLGAALWVFLRPAGGVEFGGSHKITDHIDVTSNHHFILSNDSNWLKLIGVSFLAGMVALIPGGSGAIIQLLSSMYDKIHWVIMAHPGNNLLGLCIFAVSTFFGMVTMIFIMTWGLKGHKSILTALSFGMLIASIAAIFLVPNVSIWNELQKWEHIVGVLMAIILACLFSLYLNIRVTKSINRINIK